jgi:hypothetical protein
VLLLCAAWFCANNPQSATVDLIAWARGARHFSHQERLRADVAFVLAGRPRPMAREVRGSSPARPVAPQVPAEAVIKKIDLYAVATSWPIAPPAGEFEYRDGQLRIPEASRQEPLLPPPRATLA